MRALFDYEPNDDSLLPCKEIGLPFLNGDILQVRNSVIFNYLAIMVFHLFEI